MTFYSGQNGRMVIDSEEVGKVTNWSFTTSMSPLSTTTLQDTDQTFVSGLRTTTGSCRLYYYDDTDVLHGSGNTSSKNSASFIMHKLIKVRKEGEVPGVAATPENTTLVLQVVEGGIKKIIELYVMFTNVTMAMSVGEVLAVDVAFQVIGAPKQLSL